MTHAFLLSPICLFYIWRTQKQVQTPSSVDTTVPCIAARIRACLMAHPPERARGATAFALNCNGLHVYPRHSNAKRPSLARCIRAATNAIIDDDLAKKKEKTQHTAVGRKNPKRTTLGEHPPPSVTAIRRRRGPSQARLPAVFWR